GSLVLLKNPNVTKMSPRYLGPYTILEKLGQVTYLVQDTAVQSPARKVHVEQIKPFFERQPELNDSVIDSDLDDVDVRSDDEQVVNTPAVDENAVTVTNRPHRTTKLPEKFNDYVIGTESEDSE